MAKILIVEDDRELVGLMSDWLKDEGYVVEVTSDGNDGLEKLKFYKFDLVILDWDVPGLKGIDICKEFREAGGSTPVLMLTGKKEVEDKEQGLDAGADDYLTKPFHLKELAARLRALFRRPAALNKSILKVGDLVLDPSSRKVKRREKAISLLPKEFGLLEFLMRYPNQTFSSEALLDRVWNSDSDASPDTVRIHIMRLRQKIDVAGQESLIRTVHRVGYRLETPES